jgi:hypothetical protein
MSKKGNKANSKRGQTKTSPAKKMGQSRAPLRKEPKNTSNQIFIRIFPAIIFLSFVILMFLGNNNSEILLSSSETSIEYREQSNYPIRFKLFLKLLPPDSTDDNHLQVQLQKLEYENRLVLPEEQFNNLDICITAIWITQAAKDIEKNIPINIADHRFTESDSELCNNDPYEGLIDFSDSPLKEFATFTAINSPDFFVYPFDDFAFEFYVYVYYNFIDKTTNELFSALSDEPVEFSFTNGSNNWEYVAKRGFFPYEYEGVSYNNFDFMYIEFNRPLASKLLPTTLLLFIVVLTVVISFAQDSAVFWGGIITIAIGIIGIRQILLPDFIKTSTAWDYVTIGLLVYVMAYVVMFLLRKRKQSP